MEALSEWVWRQPRLVHLGLLGLSTTALAVVRCLSFLRRCRELQCLGAVQYLAAIAGAVVGMLPLLVLIPAVAARMGGSLRIAVWVLAVAGLLTAWGLLFEASLH